MVLATPPIATPQPPFSELVLSDRRLRLPRVQVGFTDTAERLITLACSVFDETPRVHH